jgi:hypothetical protein
MHFRRSVAGAVWRIPACLTLGALLLARPGHAQACGSERLSLAESGALPLPATSGIQGWAADRRGAVALWSVAGELLAIDAERSLARTRLPDTLTPAGLALSGDTLRFLDLASGQEFRVVKGRVQRTGGGVALDPGVLLEQAVWAADTWIVALREVATGALVVRAAGSRAEYRAAPSATRGELRRLQLSPAGSRVLVTEVMAPFRVVRVDPATGRSDTLAPAMAPPAASLIPGDSLALWRALPAVALDCAVLLTLADLQGDRRVLARYDAAGRVARLTSLEAPLGMVAALGEGSLLAARRAGELELVWYSWRWVRDPADSPQ